MENRMKIPKITFKKDLTIIQPLNFLTPDIFGTMTTSWPQPMMEEDEK